MDDLRDLADSILLGDYDPTEDDLVSLLAAAADEYENAEGESFITDAEYDSLELMLRKMNPNNAQLAKIGSEVRGGKIPLPFILGSLDQVYEDDTERWIKDNSWQYKEFVLGNKEDGASGLVVYGRNGLFEISYSRGNGTLGADTTRHISKIYGFNKKMSRPCAIRVEVIMDKKVFFDRLKSHPNEMLKSDGTPYKNPRNYVSGKMNASKSPDWFYDNVRIIATSVIEPKMGKKEQYEFLRDNGWNVPHYIVRKGNEINDEMLTKLLNQQRELSLTDIDGIVIDLDDNDLRNALLRTSSSINPMFSKKYKVGAEDNIAFPKCLKVEWRASKDGWAKPRVHIEPTELDGVTIKHLTGFNAKFIKEKGIGPGAILEITRRGNVIPFIQGVKTPVEPQMPDEEVFGLLEWTEGEVDLKLIDPNSHDGSQINALIDIFFKLEVPHLRKGSVNKLYHAGFKTAASIIKASLNDMRRVVGDSAGEKVYDGIKAKLNPVKLDILAGSSHTLGRGIGRRKMAKVVAIFPKIKDWTYTNVSAVEGFEDKTASLVVDNLPTFKAFLAEIDGYYTIAEPQAKVVAVAGSKFDGIQVCFTGVRDKSLEAKIEANGGKIVERVNKETTHLVCKDKNSTSGKMAKAANFVKAGTLKIMELLEAQEYWK